MGTVKCKRYQFPLLPACAMTIHKSQGGTFNQIVYEYHKSHHQQLVYVALSRVTSLEGLFLINKTDDHKFYHTQRSTAPSIRQVQEEYKRLENHRLPTITTDIKKFLGPEESMGLIIVNLNIQSLTTHTEDVTTDPLLCRADLLVLTETWMNESQTSIPISGFTLIDSRSCSLRSGGVAVYKRDDSSHLIESIQLTAIESPENETHTADVTKTHLRLNATQEILLLGIYVHQRARYQDMEDTIAKYLTPHIHTISSVPIVLMGDFNTSETDRLKLEHSLEREFSLQLITNPNEGTTLGNTCIDLTFSRGLNLTCKPYVSYFSYHRPVFNKIHLGADKNQI